MEFLTKTVVFLNVCIVRQVDGICHVKLEHRTLIDEDFSPIWWWSK